MNTHYVLHLKESITIGRNEEGGKRKTKIDAVTREIQESRFVTK